MADIPAGRKGPPGACKDNDPDFFVKKQALGQPGKIHAHVHIDGVKHIRAV
jgi:hypothetical protein